MNIRTKATNITLTPVITEYINKSIGKITKTIGGDPTAQCDIEVGRSTNHHQKGDVFKAEIHIVAEGLDAYASAEREDLNLAITEARDEILRKIRTSHGKRISYIRRSGAKVKAMLKGLWPRK